MCNIVVPYFSNVGLEKDVIVRNAAIQYLLQLCSLCKTAHMEYILEILEKVNQIIIFFVDKAKICGNCA